MTALVVKENQYIFNKPSGTRLKRSTPVEISRFEAVHNCSSAMLWKTTASVQAASRQNVRANEKFSLTVTNGGRRRVLRRRTRGGASRAPRLPSQVQVQILYTSKQRATAVRVRIII